MDMIQLIEEYYSQCVDQLRWYFWFVLHHCWISSIVTFFVFNCLFRKLLHSYNFLPPNIHWRQLLVTEFTIVALSVVVVYLCGTITYRIYSPMTLVEILSKRSWEISEIGRISLTNSTQKILNKIEGYKSGVRINYKDLQELCCSVYRVTISQKVTLTCFEDLHSLYTDPTKKEYIESTMSILRDRGITVTRYLLCTSEPRELVKTGTMKEPLVWFAKVHDEAKAKLYGIPINKCKQLTLGSLIPVEGLDFVFFPNSVVLCVELLQKDEEICYYVLPDGNYFLVLKDDKNDISDYSHYINLLENSPFTVDMIDVAKKTYPDSFKQTSTYDNYVNPQP